MLPYGTRNINYSQDMAIVRTPLQWGLLVGLFVLLALIPVFGSRYILSLVNLIAITIITVHGLNILTGYTGQISLGQAAFMAIGGYSSAILSLRLDFPFWASLICAGLIAAIVGLIFGLPSLKVKGFYLVMATLAAHFIIMWFITHQGGITGGAKGMYLPAPQLGGMVFDTQRSMYCIIMPIAAIMTFLAKNLARTRVGRAFVAIRDNDIAAEVMGVNIFYYKLVSFFVCSFYAGIAGALWVWWAGRVCIEQFGLMDSVFYLGMMIVGGMGSILGPILGTILLRLLEEGASIVAPVMADVLPFMGEGLFAGLALMFFGVVVILFLIFEPRGLAHRWEILKSYYRLWPFPYQT